VRLRFFLYVDDVVVFINLLKAEVDFIMGIMKRFWDATGLWISTSKSSMAPIRCSEVNFDEVLQNFDGDRVSFPITYLDLTITLGQLKIVHLQPMIDRTASKMVVESL
jgi:hypothetical protein